MLIQCAAAGSLDKAFDHPNLTARLTTPQHCKGILAFPLYIIELYHIRTSLFRKAFQKYRKFALVELVIAASFTISAFANEDDNYKNYCTAKLAFNVKLQIPKCEREQCENMNCWDKCLEVLEWVPKAQRLFVVCGEECFMIRYDLINFCQNTRNSFVLVINLI